MTRTYFGKELRRLQQGLQIQGRRWIYVPYDQATDAVGPLSRENPNHLGIVLVENPWKASRRPYHKQKLALILANLRHFALEQAGRGVVVRHIVARGAYRTALEPLVKELGPLQVMEPAERELRSDLEPLVKAKAVQFLPHEGWLTTREQFSAAGETSPWRMDSFYRSMRRESGTLMKGGKPEGGKISFDRENRLPWKGTPPAPEPPAFPRDPIKEEVGRLIEQTFSHHPGTLDLDQLPATASDARNLWEWARKNCLPFFGPYEDAMSAQIKRALPHPPVRSAEHPPAESPEDSERSGKDGNPPGEQGGIYPPDPGVEGICSPCPPGHRRVSPPSRGEAAGCRRARRRRIPAMARKTLAFIPLSCGSRRGSGAELLIR